MVERKEEESPSEDIYDEADRARQLDDSEISSAEAGFMEGYEQMRLVECAFCGKRVDFEKVIERKFNDKTFWFCSERCAEHFGKSNAFG